MSAETDKLTDEVTRILDGWFGKSLENSDSEDRLREHLYEPLRILVRRAHREGFHSGELNAELPPELRR